jgi:hypothetical protein
MSTKEKKGGLFGKIKGGKTKKKDDDASSASSASVSKKDTVKSKTKKEDGNGSGDLSSAPSSDRRGREGKRGEEAPTSPSKAAGSKKKAADENRGRDGKESKSMFQRVRERSRSRSRSRKDSQGLSDSTRKDMLVAVTSCRSDGYYNQKAPGTISKLPRKAPTNLKLFHELAVGVKDAYAAVGETPQKPEENDKNADQMGREEQEARTTLWEFIGNLDFVSSMYWFFGSARERERETDRCSHGCVMLAVTGNISNRIESVTRTCR